MEGVGEEEGLGEVTGSDIGIRWTRDDRSSRLARTRDPTPRICLLRCALSARFEGQATVPAIRLVGQALRSLAREVIEYQVS